jgi:hypothetical protein
MRPEGQPAPLDRGPLEDPRAPVLEVPRGQKGLLLERPPLHQTQMRNMLVNWCKTNLKICNN